MMSQRLGRRQIPESLMGPHRVVDPLPLPQGRPEGEQIEVALIALVELLGVGALGPLDPPEAGR